MDDPTRQLDDLLSNAVRDMCDRVSRGEEVDDVAEEVYYDLEPEFGEVLTRFATYRAQIEASFARSSSDLIMELDAAVAFVAHLARVTRSLPSPPPASTQEAFSLVLARSTQVGHDIVALARAGLPNGAIARWRTLFELAVTARVLARGNRHTAQRWLRHTHVAAVRDLTRSGLGDPSTLVQHQRQVSAAVKSYGPLFRRPYGWAAELTARVINIKDPTFSHLIVVADMTDMGAQYNEAHHHVHADSFGSRRLINHDGDVHGGVSFDGSAPIAVVTITCLQRIVEATCETWMRSNSRRFGPADALYALGNEVTSIGLRTVANHQLAVDDSTA